MNRTCKNRDSGDDSCGITGYTPVRSGIDVITGFSEEAFRPNHEVRCGGGVRIVRGPVQNKELRFFPSAVSAIQRRQKLGKLPNLRNYDGISIANG